VHDKRIKENKSLGNEMQNDNWRENEWMILTFEKSTIVNVY